MNDGMIRILLVEDEEAHAHLIRRAFKSPAEQASLTVADSLREARRCLTQFAPDLLIVDLLLPDGLGIELLPGDEAERIFPIIVMTSHGNEQAAVEAMKAGALDYIVKSEATLADMPHIARRALREWTQITRRKRAEEKLRFLSLITEQVSDSVIATNLDNQITYVNHSCERIFGYSREELLGRTPEILNAEPNSKEIQNEIHRTVSAGLLWSGEIQNRRKDGTTFPCELTVFPLVDRQGRVFAYTGIQRDITRRKRAERELAKAKEAAEAASRAKSEFLANMSHEIRTPMTSVLGFTDLLMSYEVPPSERRDYLQTIQRNAQNLLTIINDILDLSKIEADRIELEPVDCSPRQIVEEVRALVQVRANERRLGLNVNYVCPFPKTIRTDPTRLRQILVNLVGNAIKFTPSGGVRITVRCARPERAPARMQFEIADTGIGMSAEEMGRLFRPFTQADMSYSRRFGGTGLGLSISQKLAKMLGGKIEVQSELHKGSTFTLTIDPGTLENVSMLRELAPDSAEEETTRPDRNQGLRGRVLLAEDDPDVQALVRLTLHESGLEIDTAADGRMACEKALASKTEGRPYDLILMDIQMPQADGYEATRLLRQEGWEAPIVALTAHSMTGDRQKCLQAGCDDYISKPADPDMLLATVAEYLDRAACAVCSGSADGRPSTRPEA